jgi:hypothetical protein
MFTTEHKQSNPTVYQGSPNNFNLNNFKIIEDMGLKMTTSRSPRMELPPYHIS